MSQKKRNISLENFVREQADFLHMSIEETIEYFGIYNLVDAELLNKHLKVRSVILKKMQERKNKIFIQELKNIYGKLNANVKLVSFKGVTLAYSLYEHPEERWFNDIDLYAKDIESVSECLMSLG